MSRLLTSYADLDSSSDSAVPTEDQQNGTWRGKERAKGDDDNEGGNGKWNKLKRKRIFNEGDVGDELFNDRTAKKMASPAPHAAGVIYNEKVIPQSHSKKIEIPIPELRLEDLSCSEDGDEGLLLEDVTHMVVATDTNDVDVDVGVEVQQRKVGGVSWSDDAFINVWNAVVDDWKVFHGHLQETDEGRRTSDLWLPPSCDDEIDETQWAEEEIDRIDEKLLDDTMPTTLAADQLTQDPPSLSAQLTEASTSHNQPPHPLDTLPSALKQFSDDYSLSELVKESLKAWYDAGYKAGQLHERLKMLGTKQN